MAYIIKLDTNKIVCISQSLEYLIDAIYVYRHEVGLQRNIYRVDKKTLYINNRCIEKLNKWLSIAKIEEVQYNTWIN